MTLDQALQQGIAAHREGKLQDAEHLYRGILQAQPEHPDANHNLGVLAVAVGKPHEAIPLFKLALETNPQIEQFWLSYIDALIKVERFDDAKRVLVEGEKSGVFSDKLNVLNQQLLASAPNDTNKTEEDQTLTEERKALGSSSSATPPQDQLKHLIEHYQVGRLEEAEALATLLTHQFPKHPFAWKVLGAVLQKMGRVNESLLPKQESADLSPHDSEAHNNLSVTLQELGRLDDAEACCRKAIALKPDFAEAHYNLGNTLQQLGRLDDAEANYRRAIALKPDIAEAHNNLGNTLIELRRLDDAEASCRQAIAVKPHYAEAYHNLGNTLTELGRLDDAEASLRKAVALKPDIAEAHNSLGVTVQELGRLDDAEASFRRAIALKPDYAEAYRNLTTIKRFSSEDEQLPQMQTLYRDPATSEKNRCHICFALAKAYEDLEEFARAFRLYAEGNALRKQGLFYDKAQDKQLFERLRENYQLISDAVEPEIVATEHAPIFIVGMPRSGTTLVEQIISSHPSVTGAGELRFVSQFGSPIAVGQIPANAEALTTFREEYLNSVKQRSEGNAIVTDKMPQNFRFLGLIAAVLPEAKIIHVKRDPAAVCWANYTQYFVNDSLGYCYSLDDILHYHELYQDLMKYWRLTLPKIIYDLDYDALTENQEEETRKLIDHLGLEWDDACLSPQDNTRAVATASSAQVRQKIYQGSSERWKRYKPYLNGALDHFGADNQ